MDWATERKLPIRLYLELEDQPAIRTENTMKEPTQKNNRKDMHPEEKEKTVNEKDHTKREITRANTGETL